MRFQLNTLHAGLQACFLAFALAAPHFKRSSNATGLFPLTLVHEFSNPTWLENLAVRHTGEIPTTRLLPIAQVILVHPTGVREPVVVADIPAVSGLLGIAELTEDVFYVVGGNFTATVSFPGTYQIWEVDLRSLRLNDDGTIYQPAKISLITTFPDSQAFNGLCRLSPDNNSTLLITDATAGSVIRLDVRDGSFATVLEDPTMLPRNDTSGGPPLLGIDGIHVQDSFVYFMNLSKALFARIPISLADGTAVGPVEVIVNNTVGDDFVLSKDGKIAWIAQNFENTLAKVDINKRTTQVVAGSLNSTDLPTTTAVAFGRTSSDENVLYASTSGGLAAPVNGNITTGGKIVRIDLPTEEACDNSS